MGLHSIPTLWVYIPFQPCGSPFHSNLVGLHSNLVGLHSIPTLLVSIPFQQLCSILLQVEKEDVPVLLVGGGRILVDCSMPLRGASRVIIPSSHGVREPTFQDSFLPGMWQMSRGNTRTFFVRMFSDLYVWLLPLQDVANAVGAALGTVGGTCEWLENLAEVKEDLKKKEGVEGDELERRAREVVLERGREHARNEAIRKGIYMAYTCTCNVLIRHGLPPPPTSSFRSNTRVSVHPHRGCL